MAANSLRSARGTLTALALVAVSACGGGGSENAVPDIVSASATTRAVEVSDMQIAQLLYSDSQRTPAAFFKENPPAYQGYVSTAHLKNTDLSSSATSAQYEMCTDDWTIALSWSDQTAAALSTTTLVESNATARYHEFSRIRTGSPPGYVRTRVYRCSYLDRTSADLRAVGGAAGTLNYRPINATELQYIAEYLWQFTSYNNYGHAVLKSSGTTTASGFEHTLVIASFVPASTPSTCDRIDVFGWVHAIDGQNGAITRSKQTLWEFGARRNAGVVELCNPF